MNLPDNFGWKYVYEQPFFLTKDSMLQWFQYRINHRILGTNRLMGFTYMLYVIYA